MMIELTITRGIYLQSWKN